ncbi:MAG: 16S rRNA (cytosine(1402)-N(4))-methyltransferase RsmH [Anaerolineae bacterium]|nr:16S rRNA (cytosine(1402)-N(4))-methyltransferase RsmH [Anaerolineae bacterium]
MTAHDDAQPHIPVLLDAVLETLGTRPGAVIIDGTLGAGGHAAALLEAAGPESRLLGIDQDRRALMLAAERLAPFGERVTLAHGSFDRMAELAAAHDISAADVILLDIGVSSMHLDDAGRGFSFRQDGPLDMRMNPEGDAPTAADVVNTYAEEELADLIWRYGEDRLSRRIARAIVGARPFSRTAELAAVIEGVYPRRRAEKIHPATRTFQALRIEVNDELGVLKRVLPQAIELLAPGGRLGVITFHSLEDRIVKQAFKLLSTDCICPPEQPVCTCSHHAVARPVTRKPLTADPAEIARNPRSRSAKLRVVEKL